MARLSRPVVALLTTLLFAAAGRAGPEPWADPKLPVRTGLELWLDATTAAGGQPPPADGKLAAWRDGSGKGRDVRQVDPAAQPVWLRAGGAAIVRFDGVDDNLRTAKQGAELRSFTVFVVAAPRQNVGPFRGLLAFNAAGHRDYTSGLAVDLGPAATPRFSALNVEGRGFGGARSLLGNGGGPFGKPYALDVTADATTVRLVADGKPEGTRPRDGAPVSLDEITVGARFCNNEPGPQQVFGPGRVDLAEILVYDRALPPAEAAQVRAYLAAKYAGLADALLPDADRGEFLHPVADPPPVQVFVPGFAVRELPVDLPNLNNLKYRPDGTLVALGYNGNLYVLRDTDGDGVEDKADLFWDSKGSLRGPIGMDLTGPGFPLGAGVLIASKGRLSHVADDGGKAGKVTVVAGGWPEIFPAVDTLGVAVDRRDGAVYYGRGCANFIDPLNRDKAGRAAYSLTDETGTIVRIAPDLKSRAVVATGIRFPVGLAFDRHGELFATDQEGATWLPNGNPFDELLHVQKGRHYGFPARHPTHLPGVIDEPSTFDYGPQHQSTCGLAFNDPVRPGGPTFGPPAWAGDALVAGYSRGKLYRTQLVKSAAGYVARTQLYACLNMLTVDQCVAPDGSLVVACHSGGPDWGSGPTGKGKLYKIAYAHRGHPQPALVWSAGPRDVRVEFDRPVDPDTLRDVLKRTKVTAGRYVRAGDRFESLWPGYAVVQTQKVTPRYDVPVRSAQLTPDLRTLVLATDPHPAAVHYAVTLPGLGRPDTPAPGTLRQSPQVDLDFDLSGCAATWTPAGGGPAWIGWLPHPDLQVAVALTAGSAPHNTLWAAMAKPGELRLTTQLDLTDLLRPAVQPGAKTDYELPPETVTVAVESSAKVEVVAPVKATTIGSVTAFTLKPDRGRPVPVEIRVTSPGGPLALAVRWTTAEDARPRPFPLRRVLVPWAETDLKSFGQPPVAARPPELEGGSWGRGRQVFFGEVAMCSKCHTVGGQGGAIGPDLSNLVHRDYPSVLRDVVTPSFAINPDHLTSVVHLKDGRTLTGVVRTANGRTQIGDAKGVVTEVAGDDIERTAPSPVSTMPEGLATQLGPDRMRDLMTFLLTPPPHLPADGPGPRPKPRPAAEVHAALAGAPVPPAPTRPLKVVLVAGPKDHGAGEHDYPAWQTAWAELFRAADKVEVSTAWEWPAAEAFRTADVIVFYQRGDWDAKRAAAVDAFLERGGGLVYVHWAVDGRANAPDFAKRIGLASGGVVGYRHGPLALTVPGGATHPVVRNLRSLALTDESYWGMRGDLPAGRVLATAVEEKAPWPQVWSLENGRGRVFVSIPGHYSWTFDDPLFRLLLLRGVAWAAKEPVDRFNDLVWPGADVAK